MLLLVSTRQAHGKHMASARQVMGLQRAGVVRRHVGGQAGQHVPGAAG